MSAKNTYIHIYWKKVKILKKGIEDYLFAFFSTSSIKYWNCVFQVKVTLAMICLFCSVSYTETFENCIQFLFLIKMFWFINKLIKIERLQDTIITNLKSITLTKVQKELNKFFVDKITFTPVLITYFWYFIIRLIFFYDSVIWEPNNENK